jgi:hypothetical protein
MTTGCKHYPQGHQQHECDVLAASPKEPPACQQWKSLAISIHCLLKAFNNINPPKKQQKAIMPKHLRAMYKTTKDTTQAAAANLAIMAFFFAMQLCEYMTSIQTPWQTKRLDVAYVLFRETRSVSFTKTAISQRLYHISQSLL